jgi:hypothetical protein
MSETPLIARFTPLGELVKLYLRFGVDRRYYRRALGRLVSGVIVEPLRINENLRYGRRVDKVAIEEPPVFILGYGRSGTTHLHNLFMQDPALGCITNYQTAVEPFALTGLPWMKKLMAGKMPSKRPMDNVAITMDTPQEEEISLINSTRHAALHFLSFPNNTELYDKYVYFEGCTEKERVAWKRAYLRVLRKATILSGGRRLVLKTPTNTARIPLLMKLFPDARFVHICRNPYAVFRSIEHLYKTILPGQILQEFDWKEFNEWSIGNYTKVMEIYRRDRDLIPRKNLVEITYEDLDRNPVEEMERIYTHLALPGWPEVRSRIETYIASLGRFAKNRFSYPDEIVEAVNKRWSIAFEMFGYERLSSGAGFGTVHRINE